jgi:bifunctional DNase/RNase
LVLLREVDGPRYLTIWIGAVEATAIAFAQQGVVPPRPLTHDLLNDVVSALGAEVAEVRITEVRDNVFYAVVVFSNGVEVSARPSDAIALALRAGASVRCSEDVLAEAGILVPESDGVVDGAEATDAADEVERFREFLDHVNPDDFLAP